MVEYLEVLLAAAKANRLMMLVSSAAVIRMDSPGRASLLGLVGGMVSEEAKALDAAGLDSIRTTVLDGLEQGLGGVMGEVDRLLEDDKKPRIVV